MSVPNLGAMRAVAERLDRVGLPYAFVGGSVVNLLIDHPELTPARPTDDVDVIIEIISGARYSEVEATSACARYLNTMLPEIATTGPAPAVAGRVVTLMSGTLSAG